MSKQAIDDRVTLFSRALEPMWLEDLRGWNCSPTFLCNLQSRPVGQGEWVSGIL